MGQAGLLARSRRIRLPIPGAGKGRPPTRSHPRRPLAGWLTVRFDSRFPVTKAA
ncbi:hypothetical protein SZ55_4035 [Pseudomonas sp. FeS53a]|nr:hypothetical protein SZ55_4035 [Pseudomonas sp. FeS53a]